MANKVFLTGRLGADPEIRYNTNKRAVGSFNIATNETWRDDKGVLQEHTEWHRCVVRGKLAEVMQSYSFKGQKVLVVGKLRTRKWVDKDQTERYITEVIVDELELLSRKTEAARPEAIAQPELDAAVVDDDDLPF